MVDKPSKPSGDFELKPVAYASISDTRYLNVTKDEFEQGRNNVGEVETPLGSVPNALQDNYMFRYITEHIIYIEQMLDYILEQEGL